MEAEPRSTPTNIPSTNSCRTDFSVLLGTSRHYYDVQIVAINKDLAWESAQETLAETVSEKCQKYANLGSFFHLIILSVGGLIEEQTAKDYRAL